MPISQIVDFPRRPQNDQPRDAAQEIAEKLQPFVGRKLRLKILEVNRKANRLILSEKVALYEERREKRDELFSSLQVGQKVTGTVRSIAPFGVFIDLGGIDGLVHKSELSWNKVNNPEAGYKVGEEVEAEVIDINHERGRISLSIRRLQPDPWHSTVADFKVGDIIDGTVTKLVNFGAFVRVRDGLEGLIHISELSHQRVAHPGDVVHEGQTLKLKIISLDSERHRLGLSLKQAEEPPARPAPERRPPGRGRRPRPRARPRPERGYSVRRSPGARGRHRQHAGRRVRPGPPAGRRRGRKPRRATAPTPSRPSPRRRRRAEPRRAEAEASPAEAAERERRAAERRAGRGAPSAGAEEPEAPSRSSRRSDGCRRRGRAEPSRRAGVRGTDEAAAAPTADAEPVAESRPPRRGRRADRRSAEPTSGRRAEAEAEVDEAGRRGRGRPRRPQPPRVAEEPPRPSPTDEAAEEAEAGRRESSHRRATMDEQHRRAEPAVRSRDRPAGPGGSLRILIADWRDPCGGRDRSLRTYPERPVMPGWASC